MAEAQDANAELAAEMGVTLKRRRKIDSLDIDRALIAERIKNFYDKDNQERADDIEARLQRYAKFRMWIETKTWPWEGACFSLDSELLTADGWKPVNEMAVGDRVYTRSPDGKAEYRPVAKVIRTKSCSAVSFKGKSIDLLVTPNHRMLIETWAGKTYLVPAYEFVGAPNKGWAIPLTSQWRGESPEKISGLPAKEYLRLLGWYVAEGSKNNGGTLSIAQSKTANTEKCEIIERDLACAGITWKYCGNNYNLHSTTVAAPALAELRDFGLCEEKILPGHVFDLCPALLEELLDAMVLGDGWRRANGHTAYGTTSKKLADQVQVIAQKIGLRASITAQQPRLGGVILGRQIFGARPFYVVNINSKKTVQVKKISVEAVRFDEPVDFACVNVPPYNTLYVRRNGIALWCGNTNSALPDMMTASMRMQDTLHNAVLSQRPPIMAKATREALKDKEETINHLIDFQFFEEQPGEDIIGQLADDFVNEGFFTCYTPWIEETRSVCEVKVFDLPADAIPADYFLQIVQGLYPQGEIRPDKTGWDYHIKNGEQRAQASFWTRDDDKIEMELLREVQIFNGPRAIRKDLQDVLHEARCENLQIKGPSNPSGASHVILRDFPSVDELKRLKESGFYDLLSEEDAEKLGIKRMDTSYQQREEQKDIMQGHAEQKDTPKGAESHKPLTRLMCFDTFDINGDGLDEDVIFWMILEDKIILRAKYLTQMFPSNPPRRPFAEGALFPVPGRRYAIGLLEMMEGIHDLRKQNIDQGMDAGLAESFPYFFYRATGNMRPEIIRLSPMEGYPLSDPQRDVYFPQRGGGGQAFMFNTEALLTQIHERLSTIGDLQLGRVPQGKASALRTVAGMQTVLAQGDARPERVLRRFFLGLAQIWQNFHNLNEVFLPAKKQFMLLGEIDPRRQPYGEADGPSAISGKFRFTFSANVLNTSKEALQAALQDLMSTYVNPLAIQLGISKPDGIYRLLRKYGKAKGQDPDEFISPPTPGAMEPPISAEDALVLIMDGVLPKGTPMEGTAEHFEKLRAFMQSDEFGYLDENPASVPIFRAYLEQVGLLAAQERTQATLLQAAAQFQQGARAPGLPGPAGQAQSGAQDRPMVQNNELLDETLPGSGGGANP